MSSETSTGRIYALAAYTFWGFAPVYFVLVAFAGPLEVLAQRIVWALPVLAIFITVGRQWKALKNLTKRDALLLAGCSLLLSLNWLVFIYGIQLGRIAETSLGYFINPLFSIALGATFLGEKLPARQWVAVALAALGVLFELIRVGEIPWIALALATSFGFYGLLRKHIVVPAGLGLGLETALLAPIALGYLLLAEIPVRSSSELGLLALGGLVTVIPLVCFGAAAARLTLTTLGFFQYLAPTLSLILAVVVYEEIVTTERWISFSFVWFGILVFTLGAQKSDKESEKQAGAERRNG